MIKIYSNSTNEIQLTNIRYCYKILNSDNVFKLKLSNINVIDNAYHIQIHNDKFNNNIDNICSVWLEINSSKEESLTIVDNYTNFSAIDIIETKGIYQLSINFSIKLDLFESNNISKEMSNISGISYFDNDNTLLSKSAVTNQNINSNYNLVIDCNLNRMPSYFKLHFYNEVDVDNLLAYSIYNFNKLIVSKTKYKHIKCKHYFNVSKLDAIKVLFNFLDVSNVKSVNNIVKTNNIRFIRIFYSDNTNVDCYDILRKESCLYVNSKNGEIDDIEIHWNDISHYQEYNILIGVTTCDILNTKYKNEVNMYNTTKLNLVTTLTKTSNNDKFKVIKKLCNTSTLITLSLDIKDSKYMTIYDIDLNHIFTNYNFKYIMSYEDDRFNIVYINSNEINIDDINFIGLKYYFTNISKSYSINIDIENRKNKVAIKDIMLLGRSFNAVIPTNHNNLSDTIINDKVAYENNGLYDTISKLPSEYVKYGQYSIIEDAKEINYIDIDLSLSQSEDKDFRLLINDDAIIQSLHNLFLSIKNDRPLKPWLEANIRNRLFDIEGNLLNHILKTYIDRYVSQVEPRVTIQSLETMHNNTNFNSLNILILFSINDSDTKLPFSFDINVEK